MRGIAQTLIQLALIAVSSQAHGQTSMSETTSIGVPLANHNCDGEPCSDADATIEGGWLAVAWDFENRWGAGTGQHAEQAGELALERCGSDRCSLVETTEEHCVAVSGANTGDSYVYATGSGPSINVAEYLAGTFCSLNRRVGHCYVILSTCRW